MDRIPKATDWKARGAAFTRSVKGWDKRLEGQEGVSGVCFFQGLYRLFYVGASGDRPDGGPANRALGMAVSTTGVKYTKRKQPIMTWQPHGNVEEGIFSAKPVVEDDVLWMFVGAIEAENDTSTSVDVYVDLWYSLDGETYGRVMRVYGGVGKEAWPLAACLTAKPKRFHVWVGKRHPAKLLTGKRVGALTKKRDANVRPTYNKGPIGHGAVALDDGRIVFLCDNPMTLKVAWVKTPTQWKTVAIYPTQCEGDIGKTLIVDRRQWAIYALAPDGNSVKVWTAKKVTRDGRSV